jgi:hypothetical protein
LAPTPLAHFRRRKLAANWLNHPDFFATVVLSEALFYLATQSPRETCRASGGEISDE